MEFNRKTIFYVVLFVVLCGLVFRKLNLNEGITNYIEYNKNNPFPCIPGETYMQQKTSRNGRVLKHSAACSIDGNSFAQALVGYNNKTNISTYACFDGLTFSNDQDGCIKT
uniref:Uncharacterized protein n=1 Tax=viral metagenome TaxID=1070528 RepID=A0A6C0I3I9_9ZZZZ